MSTTKNILILEKYIYKRKIICNATLKNLFLNVEFSLSNSH